MTKTLDAIYENGVLRPLSPLPLPEHARVTVTIQADDDAERVAWLKASQEKLAQAWSDSDDVFNELLKK